MLLDELGTSTDPGEGSALARAILSHFLVRGTMAVATTHHTDLKVFAHVTPGLQNASLDFDPVTFEPTYHLVVGVPGGSNALATALRLGLAPEIVADAKAMLAKGSQDLETLLANLREEQRKVEALRSDLEKQKDTAERQSVELANKLQQLAAEEQSFVQETHDSVVREAAELTREIRRAIADLRKERSKARIEQAGRDMAAIRQRLESELWAKGVQEPGGTGADTAGINVGDAVWLREANVRATVLSVSQKARQVEIQVGQARMKLGLDSIEKVASPEPEDTSQPAGIRGEIGRPVPPELDLRGKRADEIEWALDRYLNDASLGSLSEARIVHGFGTGTVRKIVRELLATHPLVKSFRAGQRDEGGDGVTVVRFRT